MRNWVTVFAVLILLTGFPIKAGSFIEPDILDYHFEPIFHSAPLYSNVLLMLDNSGFMNENAYGPRGYYGQGTFPGEPAFSDPFIVSGSIYACDEDGRGERTVYIEDGKDDAHEDQDGIVTDNATRFRFGDDEYAYVALRFRPVCIPRNATIEEAKITFTAAENSGPGAVLLRIGVEQADDALQFDNATEKNISDRSVDQEKEINWPTVNWVKGGQYTTPDLKELVQEVVDRPGWHRDNHLVFIFQTQTPPGRIQEAYSLEGSYEEDGDHEKAPRLFIRFDEDVDICACREYYGYFRSMDDEGYARYRYNSSGGYFELHPNGEWDGNWLNWATMKRFDVMRKALIGGAVDGERDGSGEQILKMAPSFTDANIKTGAWKKEFTQDEGDSYTNHDGRCRYIVDGDAEDGGLRLTVERWKRVCFLFFCEWRWVKINNATYNLRVKKEISKEPEAFCDDGNVCGVLQRIGAQQNVRWGNMWINGPESVPSGAWFHDDLPRVHGGYISHPTRPGQTHLNSIIQEINDFEALNTFSPLGEVHYVAMQYFKQELPNLPSTFPGNPNPVSGCDWHPLIGCMDGSWDPFLDEDTEQLLECTQNYVLLITGGQPSQDEDVPAPVAGFADREGYRGSRTHPDEFHPHWWPTRFQQSLPPFIMIDVNLQESDVLADVALYARTQDLRGDIPGDHHLNLMVVNSVFDHDFDARDEELYWPCPATCTDNSNECQRHRSYCGYRRNMDLARLLYLEAARNGGFRDINNTGRPDTPDAYCQNCEGCEGDYYKTRRHGYPAASDAETVPKIYKACPPDNYMEVTHGPEIEAAFRFAVGELLKRAASATAVSVLATRGDDEAMLTQAFFRPAAAGQLGDVVWTGYLQALWVDADGRIREDTNQNQKLDAGDLIIEYSVDSLGDVRIDLYDLDGVKQFENLSLDEIKPLWEAGSRLAERAASHRDIFTSFNGIKTDFTETEMLYGDRRYHLGITDHDKWKYLCDDTVVGAETRVENRLKNLVRYIRGVDEAMGVYVGMPDLRSRRIEDGRHWKLGDIVYSTPVAIAAPFENYHYYDLMGHDTGYTSFREAQKDRETIVYVGSNSGMMHAFAAGRYNNAENRFDKPDGLEFGDELWAYIPENLLPHLKWLPDPDYVRVPFVDLSPNVLEAKIDGEWKTILLGGFNFGGKNIETLTGEGDTLEFSPSYFAIDVTDPRNPDLMWEQTYSGLGLTTNVPEVLKVGDEWFLAIGSGPTDFGVSGQRARIIIVELKTGNPRRTFVVDENNSYFNTTVILDRARDFNVDAIYAGTTTADGKGNIYRIKTFTGDMNDPFYDTSPELANWSKERLLESPAPFAAPFALAHGGGGITWGFAGTGKYIVLEDKSTTQQNYIFGIKDTFDVTDFPIDALDPSIDLFEADKYTVHADGAVEEENMPGDITYRELVFEARNYPGWYRSLCPRGIGESGCLEIGPSERVVNKPAINDGILFVPTFAPHDDPCRGGGRSALYAVYYETGTAWRSRVINLGQTQEQILDVIYLGEGLSAGLVFRGNRYYIQMSTGAIISDTWRGTSRGVDQRRRLFWRDFVDDCD